MTKKKAEKKPAKPTPDWEKLEIIIAEIQRELEPDAVVTHNDKVRGKMVNGRKGRIRKLDVSIRKRIGTVDVLIDIDCKHHERRVEGGLVATFAQQVKDISAFGIMISDSGFDGGARDVAHVENILLQTYEEAKETDWKRLINDSWLSISKPFLENYEAYRRYENDSQFHILPALNVRLFDKDGIEVSSLDKRYWERWELEPRPRPIGPKETFINCEGERVYTKSGTELRPVNAFCVKGTMVIKEFLVNTQIASGKVIRNFNTDKIEYIKVTTSGFNIRQILESQTGVLVSEEEWLAMDNETLICYKMNPERPYYRGIVSTGDVKE